MLVAARAPASASTTWKSAAVIRSRMNGNPPMERSYMHLPFAQLTTLPYRQLGSLCDYPGITHCASECINRGSGGGISIYCPYP
jgi:hypothetical protein